MTMKKYMKPTIEVKLMTSQVAIQAASQIVTVDLTSDVEAGDIESRHDYNIWDDDEDEEDF